MKCALVFVHPPAPKILAGENLEKAMKGVGNDWWYFLDGPKVPDEIKHAPKS